MTAFSLKRAAGLLALTAIAIPLAFPAAAQRWDRGGHRGGGWDHRGPDRGYHHDNTGAIVGGALLGLGVGAAIGAIAAPPPVYYAPAPVYAAPPPVYYGY